MTLIFSRHFYDSLTTYIKINKSACSNENEEDEMMDHTKLYERIKGKHCTYISILWRYCFIQFMLSSQIVLVISVDEGDSDCSMVR